MHRPSSDVRVNMRRDCQKLIQEDLSWHPVQHGLAGQRIEPVYPAQDSEHLLIVVPDILGAFIGGHRRPFCLRDPFSSQLSGLQTLAAQHRRPMMRLILEVVNVLPQDMVSICPWLVLRLANVSPEGRSLGAARCSKKLHDKICDGEDSVPRGASTSRMKSKRLAVAICWHSRRPETACSGACQRGSRVWPFACHPGHHSRW